MSKHARINHEKVYLYQETICLIAWFLIPMVSTTSDNSDNLFDKLGSSCDHWYPSAFEPRQIKIGSLHLNIDTNLCTFFDSCFCNNFLTKRPYWHHSIQRKAMPHKRVSVKLKLIIYCIESNFLMKVLISIVRNVTPMSMIHLNTVIGAIDVRRNSIIIAYGWIIA